MPAYLESTTDQSRKLYARWGFLVREEFRMAPDAPPLWLMWRAPANAERGHAEDSSR